MNHDDPALDLGLWPTNQGRDNDSPTLSSQDPGAIYF